MTEFSVEFEMQKRPNLEAEFQMEEQKELEPVFQLNVTKDGKDATINGYNAIILNANNGIEINQVENVTTVSGKPIQDDLSNEESQRIEADHNLQEQIDDIAVLARGFVFEQATASDSWHIIHNLGKRPSVTIVDSAGTVFYPKVEYENDNECTATMNYPMLGFAYLN